MVKYSNEYYENQEKRVMGCFVFIFFCLLGFFVGGYSAEYSIEFWVPKILGKAVDVPFLPCAIAGIFFGRYFIVIAIITWLVSFVL